MKRQRRDDQPPRGYSASAGHVPDRRQDTDGVTAGVAGLSVARMRFRLRRCARSRHGFSTTKRSPQSNWPAAENGSSSPNSTY